MTDEDKILLNGITKDEEDEAWNSYYEEEEKRIWKEYNHPPSFSEYQENCFEIDDYFRVNNLRRDLKGYSKIIAHYKEDTEKLWRTGLYSIVSRVFDNSIVTVKGDSYPYSRRNGNIKQNLYAYYIGGPGTHKSTMKYSVDDIVQKINARLIEKNFQVIDEKIIRISNSSPEGLFDAIQTCQKINFDLEESEETFEKSIKSGAYQIGNLSTINRIFYGLGDYRTTVKGGEIQYEKGKYATLIGDAHTDKPEIMKSFLNSGFGRRTLITVIRHKDEPLPVTGKLSRHYDDLSDILTEQFIDHIVKRAYAVYRKTIQFTEEAEELITIIYRNTKEMQISEDKENTELPSNIELLIRLSMLEAIFNGDTDNKFVFVSKTEVENARDYLIFIDPAYQQEIKGSTETPETIKERIVAFIGKKKQATKSDISHGIKIRDDFPLKKVKSESKIIGELLEELISDGIINIRKATSGNNKPVALYSLDK